MKHFSYHTIRALYPSPTRVTCQASEDDYCVGGAFVLLADRLGRLPVDALVYLGPQGRHFPPSEDLAEAFAVVYGGCSADWIETAMALQNANDFGRFEDAWRWLEAAMAEGEKRCAATTG